METHSSLPGVKQLDGISTKVVIWLMVPNHECDFLASWRVASSAASGEFDSEWRVKHPDMQIMTNN